MRDRLKAGLQPLTQGGYCPRAVAELAFSRFTKLGEGLFVALWHENWIVAKALTAGRRLGNRALARAFEVLLNTLRIDQAKHAAEACGARSLRLLGQFD